MEEKKGIISQQEIKGFFHTETIERCNRKELFDVMYPNLKDISLQELVSLITNKFKAGIEYGKLIKGERTSMDTSLLFNPHRFSIKTKKSKHSILDLFKTERFIRNLTRVVLFKDYELNRGIKSLIEIGVAGSAPIQEFPPYVARNIYKKYGIIKTSKILDPCAGWGGRMIGASVVCDNYTAYEPASDTFKGLKKLAEWIKSMNPSFEAKIYCQPYEESSELSNYYDIALTSPPYYDTEKYTDEETNSCNKFNTFEKWVDGFYLPLIQKTMNQLKNSGVFILNIGNRKYPLDEVLINNFKYQYHIRKITVGYGCLGGGIGNKNKQLGELFFEITK